MSKLRNKVKLRLKIKLRKMGYSFQNLESLLTRFMEQFPDGEYSDWELTNFIRQFGIKVDPGHS